MSTKNIGLGRGLESLVPQNFDQSFLLSESEKIQKIEIGKIQPNADQPRKQFDEDTIATLSASIKRHGVLQPLIVSPLNNGSYVIIAGERRWRAAKLAGLDKLPVIVRSAEELEQLEIALVENVQRVDLSPLEQAASIERLHDQFNISYKDIAGRLGKAEPTVNNIVRLLQLPPEAKQALMENKISEGHARSVLALKNTPVKQTELLNNIMRSGWSVRQAEQFVVASKKAHKVRAAVYKHMDRETPQTIALGKKLSAPVSIRRTANGGKLEIGFDSDDNLETIINRLLK